MATRRRIPHRAVSAPASGDLLREILTTNPDIPIPSTTGPFLLNFSDLPLWQRDNHYILSHYRPASFSYVKCLQSLFYLHNESVNIHSHLFGFFLFFSIPICLYVFESKTRIQNADVLVFSCFFLGAVLCLGTSALYHCVSNHSVRVNALVNRLDYVGIVGLITGSFVPSIYYGFFCRPELQKLYWAMVTFSFLFQCFRYR